jgi:arginyl-tRNA synthetase
MFLDDELLEMCKNCKCETLEDIQQLSADIYDKCGLYYKKKITINSTRNEVKTILDITFNLFDSFVKSALNSNDYKLITLGQLFEKYSFKSHLLSDKKVAKIYNSL